MATVAAPLPLRAAACAAPAPFRLSSDDGARFPSRLGQRSLVAGVCRPRESAGFRVEALFGGGGGGGPKEPMVPPYNVLVTGSTKGIGYALAKKFLMAGDNVVICSRSEQVGTVRLGISRALQNWELGLRPYLKAARHLTRDSRMVERKKPARAKARMRFQWVKR